MVIEGGNPSVYDVRAYGAVGNSITDDTAAFQACIDAITGTANPVAAVRLARGMMYIPKGQYLITQELLVRSVSGFKMIGDGPMSILVIGASITNGLHLDGTTHSRFQDFAVSPAAPFTVTNLINCHWSTSSAANVTGTIFDNIILGTGIDLGVGTFVNAFALGSDDSSRAVDGCSFHRVVGYGQWTAGNGSTWQNGILLGSGTVGNNLDHCFYNCEFINVANGYNFNGSCGEIFGGQNENCGTDINIPSCAGPMFISGFRSEGGLAFLLYGAAGSAAPYGCTVDTVHFYGGALSATQTYNIITYDWAGLFNIRNFIVKSVANAAAVVAVRCGAGSNAPLTVMVDGFVAPNSQTIAQTFTTQGGGKTSFDIRGFLSRSAGEAANAVFVPQQIYNPTLVAGNASEGPVFNSLSVAIQTPTEAVLVSGINCFLGNTVKVTLTAARLVGAPLNPQIGQCITFTFVQGGAGGFAVTWNAVFKKTWSDTGNVTGARASISYVYDGTNWNQSAAQAPYV
jgi:hypothetical protein